jgi:hypothetical protein
VRARWPLLLALLVAFLLHQDLWFWNDSRIVLGLPVGLLYHLVYCLGVSVMMAVLLRFFWPEQSAADADEGDGAA